MVSKRQTLVGGGYCFVQLKHTAPSTFLSISQYIYYKYHAMGRLFILALLPLALMLLQGHPGWAARGSSSKKPSTTSKHSGSSSSSKGTGSTYKPAQGTNTKPGNDPRQPQNPNQYQPAGGSPNQYSQAGVNPDQNLGRGGVSPGGNPNLYPPAERDPARGKHPAWSGQGWNQPGVYPGGFPVGHDGYHGNKIMSPRFGGSYGYDDVAHAGISPFSRLVESKGYYPSKNSKGFGKKAALAAGAGGLTGMAVGYGLGRSSSPGFRFRNPLEEQNYHRYMNNRYGYSGSVDHNQGAPTSNQDSHDRQTRNRSNRKTYRKNSSSKDLKNDDQNEPPVQSFEDYMDDCMKRTDILQDQKDRNPGETTSAPQINKVTSTATENERSDLLNASAGNVGDPLPGNGNISFTTERGNVTLNPDKHTALGVTGGQPEDSDDTVSILEIGYPELIEQIKVHHCVEMFIAYSAHQERLTAEQDVNIPVGGAPQCPVSQGLVLLFTISLTILIQ